MQKLVIGCGYLGERVAASWQARGDEVHVLTRSAEHARRFEQLGWQTVVGDVMRPETLRALPEADTVLYAVGFDRHGGHDKRAVYVEGLRNVLAEIRDRCDRFISVSSTSVYGQDNGEFVDETSETNPRDDNGRICLDAESVVWQFFPNVGQASSVPWLARHVENVPHEMSHAVVLRLAGLYGPDRLLARVEQLRRGEPLAGNPEAWLNLIHVDDAVRAVLAAEARGRVGETYLVCDDEPIRRREYYTALTAIVGAPQPTFLSPPSEGWAKGGEPGSATSLNKRCLNRRLREGLQVELQFPTITVGLASLPETSQ